LRIQIDNSATTTTTATSTSDNTNASKNIEQYTIALPNKESKYVWLSQMIPVLIPLGKIILFLSTKESCDTICQQLKQQHTDVNIQSLHGDKTQYERTSSLSSFKKHGNSILIATDIASRGLDIPNVNTIINYDLPKNIQIYQHRIGRTGRMNKNTQSVSKGQAYTLLLNPITHQQHHQRPEQR